MKDGEEDMGSGSQDSWFEALGPTSLPPNDSPGFFTNAAGLYRGVDVTGRQLGVRGRGSDNGSVGVEGHGGPGGNGVFGQGMNGVVGQGTNGVVGHGTIGVVGLSPAAVRTSSDPAGVVGVGNGEHAHGVLGEAQGPNAGVYGIVTSPNGVGGWGVKGECKDKLGTGVSAFGDTGIYAEGITGVGLQAKSQNRAQINLMPDTSSTAQPDPTQFSMSEVGDLAVTITDAPNFPSLWFCVVGGRAGQSVWKKIA